MSRPKRGTRGSKSARPGWDGTNQRAPAAQSNEPGDHEEGPGSLARGAEGAAAAGGFLCAHCGVLVPEQAPGTGQRNHCPHCLWSLHVDIRPGDRASLCRGEMEPVALWASAGDELRIIHRCSKCGILKPNRIAGDDDGEELRGILSRTSHALDLNTPDA